MSLCIVGPGNDSPVASEGLLIKLKIIVNNQLFREEEVDEVRPSPGDGYTLFFKEDTPSGHPYELSGKVTSLDWNLFKGRRACTMWVMMPGSQVEILAQTGEYKWLRRA